MAERFDKKQLIKSILDDTELDADEEGIIALLLKEKVSRDIHSMHKEQQTIGDKMADAMAKFVGSWGFIVLFVCIIILWIAANLLFIATPFDPFPFILLNLALSCIAAIQAPIIMMSQNRQEKKDRARAQNDYRVNIKSELIVEDLYKKIDLLIKNQQTIMKGLRQ